MPSPFPGMDPYIETADLWGDFQLSFTVRIKVALKNLLRPRFASLIQHRQGLPPNKRTSDPEDTIERHVRVLDMAAQERIATVIEIFSVPLKTDWEAQRCYAQHREKMLSRGANVVEIDLLHTGTRPYELPGAECADGQRGHYRIVTTRQWGAARRSLYECPLRRPLPTIAIPLIESHADVLVNLQAVFNECWEQGPYPELLGYDGPAPSYLTPEEQMWCQEILRRAGYRAG